MLPCLVISTISFNSCDSKDNYILLLMDNEDPTISIIPDIQYHTLESNKSILQDMSKYINLKKNNINLFVGDLTQNNTVQQWINAESFITSLNSKSIICLGNHDYGENGGTGSRSKNITASLEDNLLSVSSSTYDGNLDNTFNVIELNSSIKVGILSLEFATRMKVVEWAKEIVSLNKDMPIIILTHAYFSENGIVYGEEGADDGDDPMNYHISFNENICRGVDLWDELIFNNKNVKLLFCGHSMSEFGYVLKTKRNAFRQDVTKVLLNYQHAPNGVSGVVGSLSFADNHIVFFLYSTLDDKKLHAEVVSTYKSFIN